MHQRQEGKRDVRCGAHLPAAVLGTWQTGGRCTAAWEAAAAVGPTRDARQMKAPHAPAYPKVNANLRGAHSHLALLNVHLSSHPPLSLPVPGAAALRSPRSPGPRRCCRSYVTHMPKAIN